MISALKKKLEGGLIPKPSQVNIGGIPHKVVYKDNYEDMEEYDDKSDEIILGNYSSWKNSIEVYDSGNEESMFASLLHEILHAIEGLYNLKCFDSEEGHKELDVVALALTDTFIRNKFFKK